MACRKTQTAKIIETRGNVFSALGFENPEEELARAKLMFVIQEAIKRRRLTQTAAAKIMGIDQPKISKILNGYLDGFSSDRLLRMLTMLGQDVDITIRGSRRPGQRGRVFVRQAA